jgi:type III secretion system low calcium response chaperone LcrH/SycD
MGGDVAAQTNTAATAVQAALAQAVEGNAANLLQLMSEEHTLAEMLGHSPELLEALYGQAYTLYRRKMYDEAMQAFGLLMTYDHTDRRFFKGFAACLHMLKRYEEAVLYYGLASMMDLTDPDPVLHSADCLLKLKRNEEATTALRCIRQQIEGQARYATLDKRVAGLLDLIKSGKVV